MAGLRTLTVTSSLSRNAGGMASSVRRLSQVARATGRVDVEVVGLADEHTQLDLASWHPLAPTAVEVVGPRSFGYAPGLARVLAQSAPQAIHLHGIWMYPSVVVSRFAGPAGIPYIVSPHGMLDPWALRHSRWKKRLATAAYEWSNLTRASVIRSLCDGETRAVRAFGLRNLVCEIPNGVDLPRDEEMAPPPWDISWVRGRKVLLFLGRIHPKKGIDLVITAWAQLLRSMPKTREWCVLVAGWDQEGYEARLNRLVQELDVGDHVAMIGPHFGRGKESCLRHASGFVLPSFSEGLPMAVLEAWAQRLPVVMTPECNLPEGFERGAALRTSPTAESLVQSLGHLVEQSDAERHEMGSRGHALVVERFQWERIGLMMARIFEWLIGGGSPPEYVR